jgi:hypothetical protein
MNYRVKYQVADDPVFRYSDGFNTREEAEACADDVADAGGRVVGIEMGAFPTEAEIRTRAQALLRDSQLTARQRRRLRALSGGRDFGPPDGYPAVPGPQNASPLILA